MRRIFSLVLIVLTMFGSLAGTASAQSADCGSTREASCTMSLFIGGSDMTDAVIAQQIRPAGGMTTKHFLSDTAVNGFFRGFGGDMFYNYRESTGTYSPLSKDLMPNQYRVFNGYSDLSGTSEKAIVVIFEDVNSRKLFIVFAVGDTTSINSYVRDLARGTGDIEDEPSYKYMNVTDLA